jgi:CHAT domain-containing protein
VLGPVRKPIPPGSNVIIVPDGALHRLAFETLVVPGPQPHYWIEDVAIATAPSMRVLQGEEPKPACPPRLLLIGDPVLTGQEFPPLPNAKATPASFTGIHFATHATANRESPLHSAIILSHQGENYKLYARHIAGVPLSAEPATISVAPTRDRKLTPAKH